MIDKAVMFDIRLKRNLRFVRKFTKEDRFMEIKSIQTKKIYKNIVEQIIFLIREGSLKSGDKLPPERTLAEMLDVSRASLREALSVMEIMGIVDIRPGEGSFVSDLDVLPFISLVLPLLLKEGSFEDDLIEFRRLIEIAGIKLVCKNVDKNSEMLEELKDTIVQMEENLDDAETGARLDIKFHRILFSMGNNIVLVKVLEYLGFILERTVKFNRNSILSKGDSANMLLKYHTDIYDAIVSKDENAATKAMEAHFDFVGSKLL